MLWECFIKSGPGSKPLSIEKWDNYELADSEGKFGSHIKPLHSTNYSIRTTTMHWMNIPGHIVPALILNDHYKQSNETVNWNPS